ncbi:hypothetical protein CkaCkLH20_03315 [Colletotrichum karsti]|uniref:Uncharacterized protein n=1 Tax=Colletotrichum karsti TaxID=1095194 RepID=A0A9P6IB46_9PEZI|nr:uncharacterized protein CkaCkLH20_03315 [Colletotrichum karsti]KAF9879082.1 hypothetical protein CkaCkLH20_03315 [Colletotrichum karsti]
MWCTKLRSRPEWAAAVRTLPKIAPRVKEGRLDSHDIALPTSRPPRMLRIVLLSPGDLDSPATEQRLHRLAHLQGQDAAVIFLVDPAGQQRDPMEAFMRLQIDRMLVKFGVPLIPLLSASDLPSTLSTLLPSQSTPQDLTHSESLLRHMADGPPLSEHLANLLSEIGDSPSAIAAAANTEQGRARILDLLGETKGSRVLRFLELEHFV